MLPPNVSLEKFLCGSPQASGVSGSGDGGGVFGQLERDDTIQRLQASSLKLAKCKQTSNKSLAKEIGKDDTFFFKLYSYIPRGITKPQLFRKMNEEVNLIPREAFPSKAQTLLVIVALS